MNMKLLNTIESVLVIAALLALLALPITYVYEKTHPICQNPDGTTYGCQSDIP